MARRRRQRRATSQLSLSGSSRWRPRQAKIAPENATWDATTGRRTRKGGGQTLDEYRAGGGRRGGGPVKPSGGQTLVEYISGGGRRAGPSKAPVAKGGERLVSWRSDEPRSTKQPSMDRRNKLKAQEEERMVSRRSDAPSMVSRRSDKPRSTIVSDQYDEKGPRGKPDNIQYKPKKKAPPGSAQAALRGGRSSQRRPVKRQAVTPMRSVGGGPRGQTRRQAQTQRVMAAGRRGRGR